MPGADNCPRTAGLFPHEEVLYSPHSRHIWPRPEVKKKDMVFLSDANIYSASACVGSALMGYTRFRSSTAYRRHCASREFRFSESRSDRFSISFSWQPWESFYAVSVWRAACARLTQKEAGMHAAWQTLFYAACLYSVPWASMLHAIRSVLFAIATQALFLPRRAMSSITQGFGRYFGVCPARMRVIADLAP